MFFLKNKSNENTNSPDMHFVPRILHTSRIILKLAALKTLFTVISLAK